MPRLSIPYSFSLKRGNVSQGDCCEGPPVLNLHFQDGLARVCLPVVVKPEAWSLSQAQQKEKGCSAQDGILYRASLVSQKVKNLPATWETWV